MRTSVVLVVLSFACSVGCERVLGVNDLTFEGASGGPPGGGRPTSTDTVCDPECGAVGGHSGEGGAPASTTSTATGATTTGVTTGGKGGGGHGSTETGAGGVGGHGGAGEHGAVGGQGSAAGGNTTRSQG